eukprot:365268-Chlamydomonas_euryale.AAC.8
MVSVHGPVTRFSHQSPGSCLVGDACTASLIPLHLWHQPHTRLPSCTSNASPHSLIRPHPLRHPHTHSPSRTSGVTLTFTHLAAPPVPPRRAQPGPSQATARAASRARPGRAPSASSAHRSRPPWRTPRVPQAYCVPCSRSRKGP